MHLQIVLDQIKNVYMMHTNKSSFFKNKFTQNTVLSRRQVHTIAVRSPNYSSITVHRKTPGVTAMET